MNNVLVSNKHYCVTNDLSLDEDLIQQSSFEKLSKQVNAEQRL